MIGIEYFKQQAKSFFKDCKASPSILDNIDLASNYRKKKFCLMKAQHIISRLAGFDKWGDLTKASVPDLELAKLLFDNRDKIPIKHWKKYISDIEHNLGITLDTKSRLEIFQHDYEVTFNRKTYKKPFSDYRLNLALGIQSKSKKPRHEPKFNANIQITSLPLNKEDRCEFINVANSVFESVILRMMPPNIILIRKLWNAENYVDHMLTREMLPISRDYAMSLIDAFLIHHVIELAAKVGKIDE